MPDRLVTVERDGDVLLIGIDRAAKRNAWDLQVIREVGEAYDELVDAEVVALEHGVEAEPGDDDAG